MKKMILLATVLGIGSAAGLQAPARAFDDWMAGLESSGIERTTAPAPEAASAHRAEAPAGPGGADASGLAQAASLAESGSLRDRAVMAADLYALQARAEIAQNMILPSVAAMPSASGSSGGASAFSHSSSGPGLITSGPRTLPRGVGGGGALEVKN